MSTVFSKIISGEIPSYKIYEDEDTFAFLDINPESKGHLLIVPKVEVDKVYDLPDEKWDAVWRTAKKLSKHMDNVLDKRILMKVIGTDVPHAHVHLIPFNEDWQQGLVVDVSPEEMQEITDKLKLY